ncbi:MAG: hypothetical protein RL318_2410 [Fibrobacterota bacterium]|jgi:hypothetical protein
MKAFLLAALLLTNLSGCCSFLLHDAMDQGRLSYHDSVEVRTAPGLRVMLCPRVGSPNIYRIETTPRPLFLDMDEVVLRDSLLPRHRSDSLPLNDTLELIVGTSPLGFIPAAANASRPRALLILAPQEKKSGMELKPTDGIPVSDGEIQLFYRDKGRMKTRQVDMRTAVYEEERRRLRRNSLSPLYLLTVPLDVVTSPIQLGLVILVAPFAYVIASGLGGHPW